MTRRSVAGRRRFRALGSILVALAGLVASGSTAHAAPAAALKQFKVPTSNSQPRAITNGSDGNRWFTEGTEFTVAPAKIARVTPTGVITEFAPDVADGCNFCIITDIAQGPGGTLYITSNDPTLMRFDVTTLSFDPPVQMPNTSALGGDVAVSATDAWITDFNNDVVWRYHLADGQFTSFAVSDPGDVTVDPQNNAWFTQPGDPNAPGTSNIGRIDAVTGAVTLTPTTDGFITVAPRSVTVAADGQIWFTARFTPQAIGRLDPSSNAVTLFPVANTGPSGIAASPDGSVWFTQETAGNAARITNAGVITEGKAVKGSGPFEITVDPDGNPWYTMMAANKVATLQLR
jgi:virginiamycin B lyase